MQSAQLNERMNEVPTWTTPVLIVMCSYRGAARATSSLDTTSGALGRLYRAVTLQPLRSFVAGWRDFYANPRSYEYQSGVVEAIAERCRNEAYLVIDSAFDPSKPNPHHPSLRTIERSDLREGLTGRLPEASTVVLAYPDPLGLTWHALESELRERGRSVVIVNGRRRMFLLNDEVRRALRLRRWLANTRIVELLAGFLLVPLAGLLALRDRRGGRT